MDNNTVLQSLGNILEATTRSMMAGMKRDGSVGGGGGGNTQKAALDMRSHVLTGQFSANVLSSNVESSADSTEVWAFFRNSKVFNIPPWLQSLVKNFPDRSNTNKLEFHRAYNIDTIWSKVYGMPQLEFHHVVVHMCAFGKFREMMKTHNDKCSLLRYGCMCDKFDRKHVHFVMVSLKDVRIGEIFTNQTFHCEIMEQRAGMDELMKQEKIRMLPEWPEHDHFRMKPITSDMDLFTTLRYISTRTCNPSKPSTVVVKKSKITYQNVTTEIHKHIVNEVDKLIKSYTDNCDYIGSHFNILRPLTEDAPFWFAAVSRTGLYTYVRHMQPLLLKADVSIDRKCLLKVRHLNKSFAVPLRCDEYLFHEGCMSSRQRDLERYINLGHNEYLYLDKAHEVCCEAYAKDNYFGDSVIENELTTTDKKQEENVNMNIMMKSFEYDKLMMENKHKDVEIKYLREQTSILKVVNQRNQVIDELRKQLVTLQHEMTEMTRRNEQLEKAL